MALTRALLGLVVLAIFAPAAQAHTFCVPSCPGGTSESTFQAALDDAAKNAGPDTVQLGATTFSSKTGFLYDGTMPNAGPVTIVGAGTGLTTVDNSGASNGTDTLKITGDTASTVSGLKLVVFGSGTPFNSALRPTRPKSLPTT